MTGSMIHLFSSYELKDVICG